MPSDPKAARTRVMDIFQVVPVLELRCSKVDQFSYPKMESKEEASPVQDAAYDYSGPKRNAKKIDAGPVERLRDGVKEASQKPRFGETSNEEWRELLLFSGDRLSRKKPFSKRSSPAHAWVEGEEINTSASVFEDWFTNHFLEIIALGGGERHSQAVTGSPGSGKSTLVKYAMSYFSSHLDYLGIVLSRFEFLKFLTDWHLPGQDLALSLRNYLSFIHCRDLVIGYFFEFTNGNDFRLKDNFGSSNHLNTEISRLATEMHIRAQAFGVAHEKERCKLILAEAVSRAKQSNSELMKWIGPLDYSERALIMYVLWGDKTVVTVFDGLDSLSVEDAFQDTPEWEALENIVANRANWCKPTLFQEQGIAVKADSLVVMRRNTLALLKLKLREKKLRLGISRVHSVGNIHGLSAIIAVAARSCRFIYDIKNLQRNDQEKFTESVVTIVQRTLLAISRGHGPKVSANIIYGVFDGNLRELFEFVSRIVHRSLNDMLGMNLIDSKYLFGSTIDLALEAVNVGNSYLERKSYQIVEMFLYDGPRFENVLRTVGSRSREFSNRSGVAVVQKNEACHGYVDNLFSYHFVGPTENLDSHPLLEKIRVLQCLQDSHKTGAELLSELKNRFGYSPPEFKTLLLFLLKSNLISASITMIEDDYDFQYYCTPRSKLGLQSLVESLAYVENVFHRTRFPADLVNHIVDHPKLEVGTEDWAARAVNNAFILLCYLRHVEMNRAGGVLPDLSDQVFRQIYSGVLRSIRRILRLTPGGHAFRRPNGLDQQQQFDDRERAADRIAAAAHRHLSMTYSAWRVKSLVPESQIINLLELDQFQN